MYYWKAMPIGRSSAEKMVWSRLLNWVRPNHVEREGVSPLGIIPKPPCVTQTLMVVGHTSGVKHGKNTPSTFSPIRT
jgi:hypothetical protein